LGAKTDEALMLMKRLTDEYNPQVLEIMSRINISTAGYIVKKLKLGQIILGMKLNQDIKANNGLLLAVKGQEITLSLRERLINFSQTIGIEEPFEVLVKT